MAFLNEYGRGISKGDRKIYHPETINVPGIETYLTPPPDVDLSAQQALSEEEAAAMAAAFLSSIPPENLPQEVLDSIEQRPVEIPGCPEEPDAPAVMATVYTPPTKKTKGRPAILYAAGGGLSMCIPQLGRVNAYAYNCKAVLVAPVYRIVRQSQYPGALNDLHATYIWMQEHADELGIDPDRIVILGQSSGAQLAGALAFRLKRHGIVPRGVVMFDSVVEDRQFYPSQHITDIMWTGGQNFNAAITYLGSNAGSPNLGPEAYPNRAEVEDCKGLCPFFIHTNEIDPEVDPVYHLAHKLRTAGVYTELHQWGGVAHGMLHAMEGTEYGDRWFNMVLSNLRDCLNNDLRR